MFYSYRKNFIRIKFKYYSNNLHSISRQPLNSDDPMNSVGYDRILTTPL